MRPTSLPPQHQNQKPGREEPMRPQPEFDNPWHKGSGKLQDKVALITGGDSGIGRATALAFAKEGAKVVISYLEEHEDADKAARAIEEIGGECETISGDIRDEMFCEDLIEQTVKRFGKLDILINNAAEQHSQEKLEDISAQQLEQTFRTNVFSIFYLSKAALRHLPEDGAIVNNASINAFKGHPQLVDYSSTKGAVMAFTRSLAMQVVKKGIRVNAVAPGPIWTPFIPSDAPAEHVAEFGQNTPMGRPGQPSEVAPAFVFLASRDASYVTGQTIHVNGGVIVNG